MTELDYQYKFDTNLIISNLYLLSGNTYIYIKFHPLFYSYNAVKTISNHIISDVIHTLPLMFMILFILINIIIQNIYYIIYDNNNQLENNNTLQQKYFLKTYLNPCDYICGSELLVYCNNVPHDTNNQYNYLNTTDQRVYEQFCLLTIKSNMQNLSNTAMYMCVFYIIYLVHSINYKYRTELFNKCYTFCRKIHYIFPYFE
jgi:hypothetical protein